jgi:hypothetical protein
MKVLYIDDQDVETVKAVRVVTVKHLVAVGISTPRLFLEEIF